MFGGDPEHPSVAYLQNKVQDFYIGGKVQAIQPPTYFDYVALRCKIYRIRLTEMIDWAQLPLQNCVLISRNWPGER